MCILALPLLFLSPRTGFSLKKKKWKRKITQCGTTLGFQPEQSQVVNVSDVPDLIGEAPQAKATEKRWLVIQQTLQLRKKNLQLCILWFI